MNDRNNGVFPRGALAFHETTRGLPLFMRGESQ